MKPLLLLFPKNERSMMMEKKEFIAVLEYTLLCADLDVTGLALVDDNTVRITFKGGGTRQVNTEADSYGAIIVDIMNHVF